MGAHGVAVFPADTVYGLACQPDEAEAVRRLYRLKRRRPDKPAAVMFFDRDLALTALPDLGERTGGGPQGPPPGAPPPLLPQTAPPFPPGRGPPPGTLGPSVAALGGSPAPPAALP